MQTTSAQRRNRRGGVGPGIGVEQLGPMRHAYGRTVSGALSIAPEVGHRNGEVHASIGELAENLHVGNLVVEAKEQSVQPRFKITRPRNERRPSGSAFHKAQCPLILQ